MGGYSDVDHLGEGDMDPAICAIDWLARLALPQARNDEREVATKSASLRGDDRGDSTRSRCCGLYRIGNIERFSGSPTSNARTRIRRRIALG